MFVVYEPAAPQSPGIVSPVPKAKATPGQADAPANATLKKSDEEVRAKR
jgi:hypothetical protein